MKDAPSRNGRWLESLGRVQSGLDIHDPTPGDVKDFMQQCDSPFGKISHVAPPVILSETPSHWALPPVPLGSYEAVWDTP